MKQKTMKSLFMSEQVTIQEFFYFLVENDLKKKRYKIYLTLSFEIIRPMITIGIARNINIIECNNEFLVILPITLIVGLNIPIS